MNEVKGRGGPRPARRHGRALAMVAIFVGLAPAASAQSAAAAEHFRSIAVDTGPIAAQGLPGYAERVRSAMQAQAHAVFADALTPGDPRAPELVIRVSSVDLSSDISPSGGHSFPNAGAQDTIEGVGLVLGRHRAIVSRTPLSATLNASYAGNRFEDVRTSDNHRINAITYQFAYWLKREMVR